MTIFEIAIIIKNIFRTFVGYLYWGTKFDIVYPRVIVTQIVIQILWFNNPNTDMSILY